MKVDKIFRPRSLQECYDRNICTYAFTGKTFTMQTWHRLKETPPNEGFCTVCAKTIYADRQADFVNGNTSNFYCDAGEQGLAPIPTFDLLDEANLSNECVVDAKLKFEAQSYPTESKTILNGLLLRGEASIVTEDLTNDASVSTSTIRLGSKSKGTLIVDLVNSTSTSVTRFFHSNYINYLFTCWSTHGGMVIRPSDIWFVVCSQLAKHIKDPKYSEAYRHHFSDAEAGAAKEKLLFMVANPDLLDINMILETLKRKVNINIDLFCPEFSDSTKVSREAIGACFAEAMEAYYEYCTNRCGVSKVRVEGVAADWQKIVSICESLSKILVNAAPYLQDVGRLAADIWEKRADPNTWQNFFYVKDCGSGHDNIVTGSVTKLYSLCTELYDFKDGRGPATKGNSLTKFNDGSQVTYTNIDTDTQFKKTYGIMSSRMGSDGFIVPAFNYVLLRINKLEDRVFALYQEPDVQVLKKLKGLPLDTRKEFQSFMQLLSKKGYQEIEMTKKWIFS